MTQHPDGYLGYYEGESWVDRTYRLGRFVGFPECCIREFASVDIAPTRKLDGTGYVPCAKCNEKTEEDLILAISKNRISDTEFPNEKFWK